MTDFKNESGKDFTDISSEEWRCYDFLSGATIKIEQPLRLHVSDGGHRVFDAQGVSHYIRLPKDAPWHLSWAVKDGAPNFVK